MKKKVLSLLFAVFFVLCAGQAVFAEPEVTPTTEPTVEPTKTPVVEPTKTPTVEPTAAPTSTPAPTTAPKGDGSLADLSVEGYDLSPLFSPTTTQYTVTLPAATETVRVRFKGVTSNATVTVNGATYKEADAIELALASASERVKFEVKDNLKKSYYITFKKDSAASEVSSDVSSETPSEDPSEDPSDPTSPTSSEPTGSEPASHGTDVVSVPGSEKDTKGIGFIAVLLIVLLALACGFVLCLILVRTGVLRGADENADQPNDTTEFSDPSVDLDAFEKASVAPKKTETEYTATRVMPIPKANKDEKFEVNFEYDESAVPNEEPVLIIPKEEPEPNPFDALAKDPPAKKEEPKPKKKSFFYDDDEF